jgi:hypothetical protein
MFKKVFSLVLLIGLVVSAVIPFIAPVIGIALILGGILTRRSDSDKDTRAIGALATGAGVVILVIFVLVAGFYGVFLRPV